jgi:outer membrane lipoprotein SlyB
MISSWFDAESLEVDISQWISVGSVRSVRKFEVDPLCSLQGVGGLELGQQSRAGVGGGLGFEPGPKNC